MVHVIHCQKCGTEIYDGQYAFLYKYDNIAYCENCMDAFLDSIKDRIGFMYEYDGSDYGVDTIYHITGNITDDKEVFTDYDDFIEYYGEDIADNYFVPIDF